MNIDSINNGFVIDHITAGRGMKLYELLGLGTLGCPVAMIMNVASKKMGKKDIIKIDADISLDLNVIGYVDPNATVNLIKNGELVEKKSIDLPEMLTNVINCKNPRRLRVFSHKNQNHSPWQKHRSRPKNRKGIHQSHKYSYKKSIRISH